MRLQLSGLSSSCSLMNSSWPRWGGVQKPSPFKDTVSLSCSHRRQAIPVTPALGGGRQEPLGHGGTGAPFPPLHTPAATPHTPTHTDGKTGSNNIYELNPRLKLSSMPNTSALSSQVTGPHMLGAHFENSSFSVSSSVIQPTSLLHTFPQYSLD